MMKLAVICCTVLVLMLIQTEPVESVCKPYTDWLYTDLCTKCGGTCSQYIKSVCYCKHVYDADTDTCCPPSG